MKEIIIDDGIVVLRPNGLKYVDTVHKYASNIENTKYMTMLPNYSIEETIRFLEYVEEEWKKDKPSFLDFAIIWNNIHVGSVSISFIDDETCNIGWIIDKDYWRKGIGYQAAQALVNYAVNEFKVKRLIATCDSVNVASSGIMKKLGMKKIGEYGGRKNKVSDSLSRECLYEKIF